MHKMPNQQSSAVSLELYGWHCVMAAPQGWAGHLHACSPGSSACIPPSWRQHQEVVCFQPVMAREGFSSTQKPLSTWAARSQRQARS